MRNYELVLYRWPYVSGLATSVLTLGWIISAWSALAAEPPQTTPSTTEAPSATEIPSVSETSSASEAPSEEPEILGIAADFLPLAANDSERHSATPGTRLYSQADLTSTILAMIDVAVELEVLARHGPWVEVRYASWKGWITTQDQPDTGPTATRSDPELAAWRLALARDILGQGSNSASQPAHKLGTFNLLTDVENRRLLHLLANIADHLPAAYSERFGIELGHGNSSGSGETVILFAREEAYRAYESRVRPETDRGTLGHADQGLAVLYVGRQGPDDVAAILVHELTHVLNRRHLRKTPPPWLEEGMAHDLAFCQIDGLGRLELATLGGRSVVIEEHFYQPGGFIDFDRSIHVTGPKASWDLLRKRWRQGDTLSLELLIDLVSREFFDPDDRPLRYDTSTFFIRYLLDSGDRELADRFQAYLASLADDNAEPAAGLASFLAEDWDTLEQGFTSWLEDGS